MDSLSQELSKCANKLRECIGKKIFTGQDNRLNACAIDLEILARNHAQVCQECAEAMDKEFESA